MDQDALTIKLQELLKSHESEVIEFKTSKSDFKEEKLGKYFSALSNEANLKSRNYGWLILGVDDNLNITGTDFCNNTKTLQKYKQSIAEQTTNNHTFTEIHELKINGKRVILFQIPPAPRGLPIAYKGHYYGRNGESLTALNIEKIERIRNQETHNDWSIKTIPSASINDLDAGAIIKARQEYKRKNPGIALEVDKWDDITFLNKAKITLRGQITNTAILLLGKEESASLLSPSVAQITWVLNDNSGTKKDYQHFPPPFLLNTDKVLAKIRNLNYRYIADDTLFPTEVKQYDTYVIREALHNCVAHQDYHLSQRTSVVEFPEHLIFENAGSFLPNSIDEVIRDNAPPAYYRNKFLADAMVNLNMIDTIGSGIRKMFDLQKERFFPLPDYDLSKPDRVKVTIYGKVLDKNYSELLKKAELSLQEAILLDNVQKKKPITDAAANLLKKKKLIEGRKPNYYISSHVALITNNLAQYIKNRSVDNKFYKQLILDYLKEKGWASRKDIDELLLSKLPDVLDIKQKRNKIRNILYTMSSTDITIRNAGNNSKVNWVLVSKNNSK